MSDTHFQQSTARSQKRNSKFQEDLQEDTMMSTHQTEPRPQSTAAYSLQSESASRHGCGLRFASRVMAKRRKLEHSQIQPESPRPRSFIGGHKLKISDLDSAHGSTSTVVSGPVSHPQYPEFISPVKLSGPLLLHHPEVVDSAVHLPQDSAVYLPQVVSIPALPSFGEPSSTHLRRGGNNQKRSPPRNLRFDSGYGSSGDVFIQRDNIEQNVDHVVQRGPSVHSMAGIISSADEDYDSESTDGTILSSVDEYIRRTAATEAWWTPAMSQRTDSSGTESSTASELAFRLPSLDFDRWSMASGRFAQDSDSASTDLDQSSTEWHSSSHSSQETYSEADEDADVSYLDLNDWERPAETFAQPMYNASCEPDVEDPPCPALGRFDDDEEPYFPVELEGVQFILPRRRSRETRREPYWVD